MVAHKVLHTERGDFEALVAGPEAGPSVLLLHGFPQVNETWRAHLPVLAEAGYRVMAPNQRGYGGSPRDGSYAMGDLIADAVGMLDAVGAERAVVVGHDWGGAIVWGLAARFPERVDGVVALNSPPPPVLRRHLRRHPAQLLRSSYMAAFQLPGLPERALAGRVPALLRASSHNRVVWTDDALAPYAAAFATADDLRGPLEWYRRMGGTPTTQDGRRPQPIAAPVLVIWGVKDAILRSELVALPNLRPLLAPGNEPQVTFLPRAGHFVMDEAPDRVDEVLIDWLDQRVPS